MFQRFGRASSCRRSVAEEGFPHRFDGFDGCGPFLSAPLARQVRRELQLLLGLSQAAIICQNKSLLDRQNVRGYWVFSGGARSLFHFRLVPFHKSEIEPSDQSEKEDRFPLGGLLESCFRIGRPAKELIGSGKIHVGE